MCVYTHTHIYIYAYIYIYIYIHMHMYAHRHIDIQAHTHKHKEFCCACTLSVLLPRRSGLGLAIPTPELCYLGHGDLVFFHVNLAVLGERYALKNALRVFDIPRSQPIWSSPNSSHTMNHARLWASINIPRPQSDREGLESMSSPLSPTRALRRTPFCEVRVGRALMASSISGCLETAAPFLKALMALWPRFRVSGRGLRGGRN